MATVSHSAASAGSRLSTGPLARAYAACEALARSHYENFPVASHLLPRAMRPHVAALYAFARVADDIADEGVAPPADRRLELVSWQRRLHEAVAAEPPAELCDDRGNLILAATAHSIRTLDLPLRLFDDLVSAFGQDTMTNRYASWADVLDYCRRSANPVGRLVLRIGGYREPALDRSSDALCTALQLTNFWQDFGRDWRAGRLYVPLDVAEACGAHEADLQGGRFTDGWARAIARCVTLTRAEFADGRAVCDGVRGRLRVELRVTWQGGHRILDRVDELRTDLWHRRPALSTADYAGLLWRAAWWKGVAG
jgi:squalene synthase HpnC